MNHTLQVLGPTRRWNDLISSCVIEKEFEHDGVETASSATPPPREEWQKVFAEPLLQRKASEHATAEEIAEAKTRNDFLTSVAGLKDETKFKAFTPDSEFNLVAEMRLLRHLHTHDCWAKVGDAWRTGLLPKGCLVKFKKESSFDFVLRTTDSGALCWPAARAGHLCWQKARQVATLNWRVIFDVDDVDVYLTDIVSPLALSTQADQ